MPYRPTRSSWPGPFTAAALSVLVSAGAALAQADTGATPPAQDPSAVEATAFALMACLDAAGPPSAAEPVNQGAFEALVEALQAAKTPCEDALALDPEAGEAAFHLATLALLQGDLDTALSLFRRAADVGVAAAHTRLGDYHILGIGPVDADIDRAVGHYRDAVAAGDAPGATSLAAMYQLGEGVPRDPVQMVRLLEQAADSGYHLAQYRLGRILLTGDGVPEDIAADLSTPDVPRGMRYLVRAAAQGNPDAALNILQAYRAGIDGLPSNPATQFRYTNIAAEAGAPQAIAARAFLLEQGIGTESDPDRAAAEYVRALETGEIAPDTMRAQATSSPPAWDDATARAFQVILRDRGVYNGPIDGIVGRGTRAAAAELAEGR